MHKHDPIWDRFVGPDITPYILTNPKFRITQGDILVLELYFVNFRWKGAINIHNRAENHVLIAKSFFYHIKSSESGGSVNVTRGSCVQYHVCSIDSYSNKVGCHSYVFANPNYIIESSISQCTGYSSSIYLAGLNKLIESINISFSKCKQVSGYYCASISEFGQTNFSSVFNNTADTYYIIGYESNDHNISHSKFINNKLLSTYYGLVFIFERIFRFDMCVFISNSVPCIFVTNLGDCFVDRCYVCNNTAETIAAGVFDPDNENIKTTDSLEFDLPLFSTENCNADFLSSLIDEKTSDISSDIKIILMMYSIFVCSGFSK